MVDFPVLKSGNVGIDTETHDPYLHSWGPGWARADGGRIIGVSLSTEEGSWYFPLSHNTGGNIDQGQFARWLKCQFARDDLTFIFFQAMYDLGWLSTLGLPFPKKFECTQIAAALLNENRKNFSLEAIAQEYLNVGKDEGMLEALAKQKGIKDYKAHLAEFHPTVVAPYAKQDAVLPRQLWGIFRKQLYYPPEIYMLKGDFGKSEREIYENSEHRLHTCYRNVEMGLIPVLFDMRKRGVRVDLNRADQIISEFTQLQEDQVRQIYHMSGTWIKPSDTKTFLPILRKLGMELPKTPKSGEESANKKFIEAILNKAEYYNLGDQAPLLKLLLEVSSINKALTGFLIPLCEKYAYNGRVHSTFNQVPTSKDAKSKKGAKTGRFSSENPNLQNQPARNPKIKDAIRSLYLPEDGCQWGAFDISQQELRLGAHFAYKRGLTGAERVVQRYREDKNLDFHNLTAEFARIMRDQAKTINFGKGYGLSPANLCKMLGLPTVKVPRKYGDGYYEIAGPEGQAVIDSYNDAFPYQQELMDYAQKRAASLGFVRTLLGRHCRFEIVKNEQGFDEYFKLYRAVNKLIQGSAADQTKKAMIDMHNAGHKILLSVHDDNCVNIYSIEQAKEVKEIMEKAVILELPVKTDVKIGPNWGAVQKLHFD